MRNFYLLFFLLLAVSVQAQQHLGCGTPSGKSPWLQNYQKNPAAYQVENADTLMPVPMTIHVVGSNPDQPGMTISRLMDALCTLNDDMAQAGIQFYIAGDIRYITNPAYDSHATTDEGAYMMFDNNVENTLNSYIVSNPAGNCGYNLPYAGIAMNKSCMDPNDHTWSHEVGHALALPHTFLGWEGGISYDGSVPPNFNSPAPERVTYDYTSFQSEFFTDTLIVDTAFVERVDGTNCAFAADGFCDTPPDYLAGRWPCDDNNLSPTVQTDPNGETFTSNGIFIMSYAFDNCSSIFSDEQIMAMRANLNDEKSNLLVPFTAGPPMSTDAVPIFPTDGASIPLNNALLSWEPVDNATGYSVRYWRVIGGSRILLDEFATTDAFYLLPELLEDRMYEWSVRPYSITDFCGNFSERESFIATARVSSTNDPAAPLSWKLVQNPVSNSSIQVIAPTQALRQATFQLLDLNGKVVYTHNQPTGVQQIIEFPTPAQNGLYLLSIQTGDNQSILKVMVQ